MAGQDGLEPARWTGDQGSEMIHLMYIVGKLVQETQMFLSVKPSFGFILGG